MPFPSVASPALRLHAVSAGRGPTVACLHSSGSSSSQWRRLIESEQDEHHFVAFDLHGHGRSPDYEGERYELRCESDAVWRSIDALGGPVHLVGHSYGGAVALDLAVRHPERIASVTLFEPVLFALLEPESAEYREIAATGLGIARDAHAGDLDGASADFIDYWNGPGAWRALPVDQQERVRARIVPVARHFEALFADPLPLESLRSLRVPTLVLRGDRSPGPAREVCARLAVLPCVSSEVFPGLGHMAPVTHSSVVNPRIAAWLGAAGTMAIAA